MARELPTTAAGGVVRRPRASGASIGVHHRKDAMLSTQSLGRTPGS